MWRKIDGERREMWSQKSRRAKTIVTMSMLMAFKKKYTVYIYTVYTHIYVSKSLLAGCSSPYLPGFLH